MAPIHLTQHLQMHVRHRHTASAALSTGAIGGGKAEADGECHALGSSFCPWHPRRGQHTLSPIQAAHIWQIDHTLVIRIFFNVSILWCLKDER